MNIGVLGTGAALAVAESQIALTAADVDRIEASDIGDVDMVLASDAAPLSEISKHAIDQSIPHVTIEYGTLGGHTISDLEGAVFVFGANGPCFACLEQRIASTGASTEAAPTPPDTMERILGAIAGKAVVDCIRGATATGIVYEFPYRERRLLPVPGCTCEPAGYTHWSQPTTGTARSVSDAIDAAEQSLDDHIGIVTEIGEAASRPLPYYLATLADTAAFSDASAPTHAAGVAEDWDRAFMKGIGEALERYAAGTYRESWFEQAHPDALADSLPIDACVRPPEREPIEEPIAWVPGEQLITGERCWLPAELVVFPPNNSVIRPPITTGLALGNTPAETLLGGLFEVIERDAAMLAWYSTYEPVAIDIDAATYTDLTQRAALEDLTVETVLLTQDIDVPVLGAFVYRDDPWPRFAAGSAAGFDPVATATDAVREALQNWIELAEMGQENASGDAQRIARYAVDTRSLGSFISPDVRMPAAEIAVDTPDTPEQGVERLLSHIGDAGMTPTAAWVTPRDLRSMDFCAARVVIPEAQPLLMGTPYFGQRAEQVPQSMGFEPTLDIDPHPFP